MTKKKPIVFFNSFEEQEAYSLQASLAMSPAERLSAMHELNEKLYGPYQPPTEKIIHVYVAKPGESVNEFRRRIDKKTER